MKTGIIPDKQTVSVLGLVKQLKKKVTKTNKLMGILTIEDLTGETDVIVFPASLEKYSSYLNAGEVVLLTAEATLEEPFRGEGEDVLKLLFRAITLARPDNLLSKKSPEEQELYLKITRTNKDYLDAALALIKQAKGKKQVYVYYRTKKALTGIQGHIRRNLRKPYRGA